VALAGASEAPDEIVLNVRIESDARIDKEGLRRMLPFQIGAPFDLDDVAEARGLLELKGIFRSIEIEPVRVEGGVTINVRLKRMLVINMVRAYGYEHLSRKEMSRLIRLQPGMMFDEELVNAAVRRVEERYRREGFIDVYVVKEIKPRPDADVDIEFWISEGRPQRILDVVVQGTMAVPAERLERAIAYLREKYRTRDSLREAERVVVRELRQAGYYEARARATWEPTSEGDGVVWVAVETGPRFEIAVQGNEHKKPAELLNLMNLLERLVITDGTWRELARRMTRDYRQSGFRTAKVAVHIEEGDPKRVTFNVREGRRYRVRAIRFRGNKRVSDQDLRARILTAPGRWFPLPRKGVLDDQVLEDDMKRLLDFYLSRGFESAAVDVEVPDPGEAQRRVEVTFAIDEGLRTVVRKVSYVGFDAVDLSLLNLRVQAGRGFNADDVEEDRKTLLGAFGRLGYAEVQIGYEVKREVGRKKISADVSFTAEAGVRREIGTIIVQGNIDTRDRVILRELPFKTGAPLDVESLLRGQSDIYKLGLFRGVSVQPIESVEPQKPDVGVRVTERPAGTLEWGAGFNTRDGLTGFAETGYENLGGMARRIALRLQGTLDPTDLSSNQYLGSVGYREPRLFDSKWRFSTTLLGERSTRDVDQFSLQRVSLTTSIDREILPRLRGGLEFQVEQSDIFDVAPGAELGAQDEGSLRTIAPSPFLIYDARDNAFSPTHGFFDSIRFRYALPELSSVHLTKVSLQHSQWWPLVSGAGLIYSARIGWADALSAGDEVPIRERFFLGGRTTVRGFPENSIGPFRCEEEDDPSDCERERRGDDPIGGDLAINLNLELRVPLVYGFAAGFFTDGGGVYLIEAPDDPLIRDESFTLDNFRRTAGLGLRYNTPIGPLSLDYGIKLDRRAGESFGEVHFNIGSMF
jgi:outer membrane protein insertion porin family